MSRTTLTLPALRCDRCGHTWIQRRPEMPKVCSRCKRTDWNTPTEHESLGPVYAKLDYTGEKGGGR